MSQSHEIPAYLPVRAQLLTGIAVRDLSRSMRFYGSLGFDVVGVADDKAEAHWGQAVFTLNEREGLPPPPETQAFAGLRILVPDVETYWQMTQEIGARVIYAFHESDDGLRQFRLMDPDGFSVTFATEVAARTAPRLD